MSEWKDFNVDESYNKSMNTPTPETNAVSFRPTGYELCVSSGFACKLERQRDEALRRCSSYSDDCAMMDGLRELLIQVRGERDSAQREMKAYQDAWYKDQLEIDKLRRVCNDLAKAIITGNDHGYGLKIGDKALVDYSNLPHVKRFVPTVKS